MLLNYLKLAVRLLLRNPFFTFVNIFGLSIGFASFFALWQYSSAELKMDEYHKDSDRIARIGHYLRWTQPDGTSGEIGFGFSFSPILPELKNDFPEIEAYVRILGQNRFYQQRLNDIGTRIIIKSEGPSGGVKIFKEKSAAYADHNLFDFFSIPLLSGNPETVLSEVNFVALSQSTAIKYFGKDEAVGKRLILNDSVVLKVTGVYEDFPHNTHLNFDLFISNKNLLTRWNSIYTGGTHNYVKLKKGTDLSDFENKLNRFKDNYQGAYTMENPGSEDEMFVQPLNEIAFSEALIGDDDIVHRSKTTLIALMTVSIVVLIMAWINYTNLSISTTTRRMKEFETRKVVGASTSDLTMQLLIELVLINILSLCVSFTLLQGIRSPLHLFFNIHVSDIWSVGWETWVIFLSTLATGILITGLYPAYISVIQYRQKNPIANPAGNNKKAFSSILTTVQFTAAIILIFWAFVVYAQLNHILTIDIGMARFGIVVIESPVIKSNHYDQDIETLVVQLGTSTSIQGITASRFMVGESVNRPGLLRKASSDVDPPVAHGNGVDENFIPFFGMRLLAGRNFVNDDRADVIILSRTSASNLGFLNPEEIIGINLEVATGEWNGFKLTEVIGVIEDIQVRSFFQSVNDTQEGSYLVYKNRLFKDYTPENILLKVEIKNADDVIAQVESKFHQLFPGNVFSWRFLDDQINQAYSNEKIARNQILLFTILAIGIACLGLLAMLANKINEKTKEIGIRKVLGANSLQIGKVLLNTTVLQFVIALLLGLPFGYYLGTEYLQKYSVRITLFWWYAILPVSILAVIMTGTIATALIRAVRTNPVNSLRNE